MKRGDMKHSTMNRHFFDGPRICSQCNTYRPRAGGKKVPTGRITERWVCAECAK